MQHRFVQIANSLCAQLHGDIGSSESIPEVTALYAAHADKVVWGAWPTSVHPRGGDIPETRCARKEEQVKAMVSALSFVIDTMQRSRPRRLRFVEFCAGSGYVALPLACLYPALQLTVLDLKEQSVQRARRRVLLSGLRNVEVRLQDISTFDEEFDVGASLHACGSLSDQVLQKCVERRAAFVICPCCIGKVLFTRDAPLSHRFAGLLAPVSREGLGGWGRCSEYDVAEASLIQCNADRFFCAMYRETSSASCGQLTVTIGTTRRRRATRGGLRLLHRAVRTAR
ncbi:methyltransferase [archaeon]|nr:MAG: methyltransferase [archaeon]